MNKRINFFLALTSAILISSCGGNENIPEKKDEKKDTVVVTKDTPATIDTVAAVRCKNDSLDELAMMIAGMTPGSPKVLNEVFADKSFAEFSSGFDKKWREFDSSRITLLEGFRERELGKQVGETSTLFYPFSGPDFLYANAFFPDAEKYILMGLEPVGTLPVYDEPAEQRDSMAKYFAKVKPALHAILNFSFFRTAAMKTDLKNTELDGTLHLLLLFIKRTGHEICSVKPGYIDTTGTWKYASSFPALKSQALNNKGIEIKFTDADGKLKTLYYFSLHLEDGALKKNKNIMTYFAKMEEVNTYLKGASYLMHETYFSEIRNTIFRKSRTITQDDSGIALRYFAYSGFEWDYKLYGKYVRPISLFSYAYQAEMDSLWKQVGSTDIGFGIGYNFRDKNSNLMVAKKGGSIPIPAEPMPKKKASSKTSGKE